jgi:hypothetical protein
MNEHPDPIERTLEVLLYAPIGIGLFLKDTAPALVDMFVARGRAEFDRRHDDVQQRVTTARSLGEVAMAFGPPMVRDRVGRTVDDARRRAGGLLGSPSAESIAGAPAEPESGAATDGTSTTQPDAPPAPDVRPPAPARPTIADWGSSTPGSEGGVSASAALPIPGYDALSASQVVERLIGLAPDELDAVHAYESSHRQRRTILGKIEQLAG